MIPARPQELPDLRLEFISAWQDGGFFHQANKARNELEKREESTFAPMFERETLRRAQLYWCTEDMADLIMEAAPKLPPTTARPELPPSLFGLVYFAKPLVGLDVITLEECHVDAIVWGPSLTVHPTDGLAAKGIAMSIYGRPRQHAPAEYVEAMRTVFGLQASASAGIWLPLGAHDWLYNADTDMPAHDADADNEVLIQSSAEDRRWFATFCLLCSQPLAQTSPVEVPRPTTRRSQRAQTSADVRLIDLRAAASRKDGPMEPASSGEREVAWSHRWIVGAATGGFWRQQAYGPGRAYRRPVWIAPFVKGPADKPLKVKEVVNLVRGETPKEAQS